MDFNKTQEYIALQEKYFGEGNNPLKKYCDHVINMYINEYADGYTIEDVKDESNLLYLFQNYFIDNDYDYQCVNTLIDYFRNQGLNESMFTDIFKKIIISVI